MTVDEVRAGNATGRGHLRAIVVLVAVFLGLVAVATALGKLLTGGPPPFDTNVVTWLASARSAPLTSVAQGVTFLGSTLWLVCLTLIVGTWLIAKRRPSGALLLLLAAAGATAIDNLVKVLVGRVRPDMVTHLAPTSTFSFPSGHACSAAAVYLVLALGLSRNRALARTVITAAVVLAIAVALSRVYLGVHYPTDVVAGLALGWLWAAALVITGRHPPVSR